MKSKKEEIGLEGSIWFQKAENKFLGGESITLLEKIDDLGSINSAAKAAGISYKTAWHLVNMMNNQFWQARFYKCFYMLMSIDPSAFNVIK